MELVQVLHMKEGVGDASYANNSGLQKTVISKAKHVAEEAITNLYCSIMPQCLRIAELGCSSGPNALFVILELVSTAYKACQKLGRQLPEIQVFLNDLPGNDFNTLFKTIAKFQQNLSQEMGNGVGPCYFMGVPGSFYGRLFPNRSLHFVHSSYSVHWLSQVPPGLEDNKANIFMSSSSPRSALKAYYAQFQKDFSVFLKHRAEEIVEGGRMVVTIMGRRSEDPTSKECCYSWELLALALRDMVSEGLIEEEKLDSFNIPQYTPSPTEMKLEIEKEGSFVVDQLEVFEVDWDCYESDGPCNAAKCMRAVSESMFASHFGSGIIEEVFRRHREIVVDRMSKEKPQYVNLVVSMTRSG